MLILYLLYKLESVGFVTKMSRVRTPPVARNFIFIAEYWFNPGKWPEMTENVVWDVRTSKQIPSEKMSLMCGL